ncbi:MAG: ABC transporter ATP-binding protein [Synechococcales bacterium]|nr:ABC transporter ATP-binding protein [Synechococcales bacterium]
MSQSAIALSHLSKTYPNGTVALQDLNLAIQPTDFVSLLGPSGCGKSTVLKLIAGLALPTTGTIQRLSQRKLAYVFQEASLMPWATVADNVRLPLKLAGLSQQRTEAAVAEAIALVHLQGFERCYPRELSGGMKMRVSIARALVTQPDILLMDEPFGALDEMTRSQLNCDLLTLWQEKRWTVVFVTHNIYEAVYLSNRVVVMASRPGRVVAEVDIDVPYPRPPAFRTSSTLSQYCRQVSGYLYQAGDAALANPY